jgi:two-component system NtrC family sensor kinase
MRFPAWTHSLRWRIVSGYALILIIGGVSASVLGIRVTSAALLTQIQRQVDYGLSAVSNVYSRQLAELQQCVTLLSDRLAAETPFDSKQPVATQQYLRTVRTRCRIDFLSVADAAGDVILRTTGPSDPSGSAASLDAVTRALGGEPAAGAALVPLTLLAAEDPRLAERVRLSFGGVEQTSPPSAGLALVAASPICDDDGRVRAVVYAGSLLNDTRDARGQSSDPRPGDALAATVSAGRDSANEHPGVITVFQGGTRISTNVVTSVGQHALGTSAAPNVYAAVIERGENWHGPATVLAERYIAAYEPITDLAGQRIGMLGVGLREQTYTAVRNRVSLIFAGIALFCFALIVLVTILLTRSLMRPLHEIVAVSRRIIDGDMGCRVHVHDPSELGVVSSSFNAMLDQIREMNVERYSRLEQHAHEWTDALVERVRERNAELAKTQAALGRQQRLAALGQFSAGVAHEINNPLGGILTFASLIREALPDDSPIRADAEEVVAQAERCRKIVRELLEFSRQRDAQIVRCDITKVVERTLALLDQQASFQNIRIVREFDPGRPVVLADESQMQQVFINLFVNAADAMNERGTLTITIGNDEALDEVFVRVTDTGCGVPENLREAIFDPFFTTKDPGEGTGLGLAVACRLVASHGGRLELQSEVGRGATFTVLLSHAPAE